MVLNTDMYNNAVSERPFIERAPLQTDQGAYYNHADSEGPFLERTSMQTDQGLSPLLWDMQREKSPVCTTKVARIYRYTKEALISLRIRAG